MTTTTTPIRITANVVRDLALPAEQGRITDGVADTKLPADGEVGTFRTYGDVHRDERDGHLLVGTNATIFTIQRSGTVNVHVNELSSGGIAVTVGQYGNADDGETFITRDVSAHMRRTDAIRLRDALNAALGDA